MTENAVIALGNPEFGANLIDKLKNNKTKTWHIVHIIIVKYG